MCASHPRALVSRRFTDDIAGGDVQRDAEQTDHLPAGPLLAVGTRAAAGAVVRAAVLLAVGVAALATPAAAQTEGPLPSSPLPLSTPSPPAHTDTSTAAATAALRVEQARLRLARRELGQLAWFRRLRPRIDLFVSVSTRGLAFPSISSQGYDPAYAAIARWPGDTWGVTVSWSLDQLLDRRPLYRARAAVDLAEARVELHHARRAQQEAARRERLLATARRDAEMRRRAALAAELLRTEAGFLARRLDAERELLRLAQMKYDQGDTDFEALARQRLAVLSAEHACATNTARLAAVETDGGSEVDPFDLAFQLGGTVEE